MQARLGQILWLLIVCAVVWVGIYVAIRDTVLALWVAGGALLVIGTVILIRPFRREDWEDVWEKIADLCWWL